MFKVLLFLLVLTSYSFSQKLEVTPNGLRDQNNLDNSFVVILDSAKKSNELYQNAINYIKINYKNPNEVVKTTIENSYLKFETFSSSFITYNNSGAKIPINTKFTTELKFQDGKIRFEIIELDMTGAGINSSYKVLFSGGLMSGYIIYKNNGTLFKEDAKVDVENYFNTFLTNLINGIKTPNSNGGW